MRVSLAGARDFAPSPKYPISAPPCPAAKGGVRVSVAGANGRFSRGPNATAVARVSSRYRTVPSDRRRQFVFESGRDSRTPPPSARVTHRHRPTTRPGRASSASIRSPLLPARREGHVGGSDRDRSRLRLSRCTGGRSVSFAAKGRTKEPRTDCGFAATISIRHDSADCKDDTVPAFEDCVRGREVRAHDWAVLAVEAESAHDGVGAFISGEGEHREVGSKRTSGRPGALENMSGARH